MLSERTHVTLCNVIRCHCDVDSIISMIYWYQSLFVPDLRARLCQPTHRQTCVTEWCSSYSTGRAGRYTQTDRQTDRPFRSELLKPSNWHTQTQTPSAVTLNYTKLRRAFIKLIYIIGQTTNVVVVVVWFILVTETLRAFCVTRQDGWLLHALDREMDGPVFSCWRWQGELPVIQSAQNGSVAPNDLTFSQRAQRIIYTGGQRPRTYWHLVLGNRISGATPPLPYTIYTHICKNQHMQFSS